LTKAKLPLAKHNTSRAEDAWTGQVRTEKLTYFLGNADSVAQLEIAPYAQTNRLSRGIGS